MLTDTRSLCRKQLRRRSLCLRRVRLVDYFGRVHGTHPLLASRPAGRVRRTGSLSFRLRCATRFRGRGAELCSGSRIFGHWPITSRSLTERSSDEFPQFNPAEGRDEALLLFLCEKPGPMTSADDPGNRIGSGFIGRDDDEPPERSEATVLALPLSARRMAAATSIRTKAVIGASDQGSRTVSRPFFGNPRTTVYTAEKKRFSTILRRGGGGKEMARPERFERPTLRCETAGATTAC